MNKSDLDLSQRIFNAASSQQVERLHGIHNYLHAKCHCDEEWSTIWSCREDCSWAHEFGRMRGMQQVWWGNVGLYNGYAYDNYNKLLDMYPDIAGLDARPLMEVSMHTLVNSIVEVAADGQSARTSFVTPGILYDCLSDRAPRSCINFWERYGSDFILEDGHWKYLHEQVCPDNGMMTDFMNAAADEYRRIVDPPKGPGRGMPQGDRYAKLRLADKGPLHKRYSIFTPIQNTVPWPEPYDTLDNNNSYTIPVYGHPLRGMRPQHRIDFGDFVKTHGGELKEVQIPNGPKISMPVWTDKVRAELIDYIKTNYVETGDPAEFDGHPETWMTIYLNYLLRNNDTYAYISAFDDAVHMAPFKIGTEPNPLQQARFITENRGGDIYLSIQFTCEGKPDPFRLPLSEIVAPPIEPGHNIYIDANCNTLVNHFALGLTYGEECNAMFVSSEDGFICCVSNDPAVNVGDLVPSPFSEKIK